MLRSNGEFITYILSSISPVSRPWGICVDSKNRIWLVEENTDSEYVRSFTKRSSKSTRQLLGRKSYNVVKDDVIITTSNV